MKNKFGETVWFNKITEKPVYNLLKNTYPLPSGYTEVPYIQTAKGAGGTDARSGRIVLTDFSMADVHDGDTLHINFNMSRSVKNTDTFFWFGSGRFYNTNSGYIYYNIGVIQYKGNKIITDEWNPNGEERQQFYVCCVGQHWGLNTCVNTSIEYTAKWIYNFNLHYTRTGAATKWGGSIDEVETGRKVWKRTTDAVTGNTTEFDYDFPLCIFDLVARDLDYPQYYGWGYNNRATSTGPNLNSSYAKMYKRFYSRGKIMINDTIYMYLYTCYKNDTHQYGIYDAVTGHFYGDFIEGYNNIWTNNPNYYWEHIAAASGDTRQEKEMTFLNICGPEE